MFKHIIISALLLAFSLTSCRLIVYQIHDLREVEPQSNSQLLAFCREKKIAFSELARIKQDSLQNNLVHHLNKNYLFDRNGIRINFSNAFENPKCKGNLIAVLKNIDSAKDYPRDSGIVLKNLLTQTTPVFGPDPSDSLAQSVEYDYSVLIYWNTFSGNPNHTKAIADIRKAIQDAKTDRIAIILVNQDFHPGTPPTIHMNKPRLFGRIRKN
jgi:hypothetical protein